MDLPRSPEHTDFKRATPVHGSRGPLPFSRPYLSPPPLPLRKYSHLESGLSRLRTARNLNPGPLNATPERELHPVDDNITHLIQNATTQLLTLDLTRELWMLATLGPAKTQALRGRSGRWHSWDYCVRRRPRISPGT